MDNKITLTLLLFIFLSDGVNAQQQALYSQYMFNGMSLNPAYAGSNEATSLTLLSRKQWLGMNGAPTTHTFSAHSPLKDERVGVGIMVIQDKIAVTSQTGIYGAYAYRIPVGKGKLALGLQAGFTDYKSLNSELLKKNGGDPVFTDDIIQGFLPNFGTGFYYYDNNFYIGASVPHILTNEYLGKESFSIAKQARHYFLSAGYLFELNHHFKLKPNILLTGVEGAPIDYDFNLNLLIKDVLWVGTSTHSFNAYDFLLELQLTDQLKFGYSYALAGNDFEKFESGSHEFMINYVFTFYKNKIVSPRYL